MRMIIDEYGFAIIEGICGFISLGMMAVFFNVFSDLLSTAIRMIL